MHKPLLPTLQIVFTLVIVILLHSGCVTTPPATPPPIIDNNKPIVDPGDGRIPDSGTSNPTFPTTGCDCGVTYAVKPKDTLYGIATQCCLDYKDLARWNKLPSSYEIRPGQILTLSGPTDSTTLTPSPVYDSKPATTGGTYEQGINDEGIYHTVAPQENLYRIAKHYNRTVDQIKQWNGLQINSLTVGQRLRVSPPSGKDDASEVAPPVSSTTTVSTTETRASPAGGQKSSGRHLVNPSDTLYNIAKMYGYSEGDIAAWNDLQPPYTLAEGQILVVSPPSAIPPSSASRKTTAIEEGKTGYHTVMPGDTLLNVSKRYGCTVTEVKTWNGLSTNQLSVGQQLRVVASSTETDKEKSTTSLSPPNINYIKHKVRDGETLYRIATQYGMKEEELAHLNGIGPPYTVYPGQELTILPKK